MVTSQKLDPRARAYIVAVVVCGAAAGMLLAARAELRADDLAPLVLFSAFAVLAATLDIPRREVRASRLSYQIGSSFTYPLLLLLDPGAACLVFTATTLADKLFHRRGLVTTGFNVGNLMLASAAAVQVRHALLPAGSSELLSDGPALLAATVSLVTFALVNNGLTRIVLRLVNGQPVLCWDASVRLGLLNETLCVVSGLGMAALWQMRPGLVLLGAIPIWVMGHTVARSNRHEGELEAREHELRSLQRLGLEIGSELDIERLRESLLRIASQAAEATGGVLGPVDWSTGRMTVLATRGIEGEVPATLQLTGLGVSATDCALLTSGSASGRPGLPRASSMLGAPVRARGQQPELLLLLRDDDRVAFGADDVRRVATLVPFAEVALANARLVTERKELEAQLLGAEKMSALGVLVAGVAHELNNPLTSVLGYAELLAASEPDARRREKLGQLGGQARRAAEIVQKLGLFARMGEIEKRPVDLNQIVSHVLEFRAEDLAAQRIEVERKLGAPLPAVLADVAQMHQVLLQLLSNAMRALEGLERTGRIVIETRAHHSSVRLSVRDNGPGVPVSEVDRIFLPFYTTKEVGRGPGLGLSICYGIVCAHGGSIRVEAPPDGGAAFVIDLPPASGGAPQAAPPPTPVAASI
jgi:signal transduction histidine kinase